MNKDFEQAKDEICPYSDEQNAFIYKEGCDFAYSWCIENGEAKLKNIIDDELQAEADALAGALWQESNCDPKEVERLKTENRTLEIGLKINNSNHYDREHIKELKAALKDMAEALVLWIADQNGANIDQKVPARILTKHKALIERLKGETK